MPEREVDILVDDPRRLAPSPEEVKQYTDRIAQVGERGMISARLDMDNIIPKDIHYEWIDRTSITNIHQYESMGFEIETRYGVDNPLHSDGTGKTIVGDVVLMTIPKWKKELIDQEYRRRSEATNNNTRIGPEVRDLKNTMAAEGITPLDPTTFGGSNEATSKEVPLLGV